MTSIVLAPLSTPVLPFSPIDSMSSFTLSIHRSLGLPLFLFPKDLVCSALCGILRSTTLSNRVVWLPKTCLMPSFLIFCSFETPAIFRSQLVSAARILFSSCLRIVRSVLENRLYHRLVYFYLFLC